MGWVDWLMRPFRRPVEDGAGPPPGPTGDAGKPAGSGTANGGAGKRDVAPEPRPDKAADKAAARAKAKARAERRAAAKTAAGADGQPAKRKKNKRDRKYSIHPPAQAASAGPSPDDAPRPAPSPSFVTAPAHLSIVDPDDRPEPPPPLTPPAEAPRPQRATQPPADPAAEAARRAEAADNRRRARLPKFQALLSRADALLAVADAEPRHLAAARKELASGWTSLGPPPPDEAETLGAARDARLAALDERLQAAAAAVTARNAEHLATRWAVVVEARALAEREDLKGAGPEMGALRAKLRAVPLGGADDPTVAAFAEAEKRLKQRQEQHRTDRDNLRQERLAELAALVQRAEQLAASRDPESAAERVKSLQAAWKAVRVPGPRAEVDEAWARFRGACDAVFAARTQARLEAGKAALERMEAIVVKLEAMAEDGAEGDPEDVIAKTLITWKRIGRAPREAQQALWERLQKAFDTLRSPPVELGDQDPDALQFRPFQALSAAAPEPVAVAVPEPEPVPEPVAEPAPVEPGGEP